MKLIDPYTSYDGKPEVGPSGWRHLSCPKCLEYNFHPPLEAWDRDQ